MEITCRECDHVFEGVMGKVLKNMGFSYYELPRNDHLVHGYFEGRSLIFECPKCGNKNVVKV